MRELVLLILAVPFVSCQLDAFALPSAARYAPKPTVPSDLRQYFELDGHARELVESLIGPRPGGFFPEKTFEVSTSQHGGPQHQISGLERTLEQFFTAPEGNGQMPNGLGNGGFSFFNGGKPLAAFQKAAKSETVAKDEKPDGGSKKEDEVETGSGEAPSTKTKSSILGIPNFFPKLPKAPLLSEQFDLPAAPSIVAQEPAAREPIIVSGSNPVSVPSIATRPEVPEGGFLPVDIRRAPPSVSQSVDEPPQPVPAAASPPGEYGGLSDETSGGSNGGLIGTIINFIQMAGKNQNGQATQADKDYLSKTVTSLLGGENSPLPAKNMLSNVLYKALTQGSVQSNGTSTPANGTVPGLSSLAGIFGGGGAADGKNLTLTNAQKAAIGENLEMIQNLIIQPSSPLCTNKPQPVDFDMAAFMGQWYQVIYSPPLSSGACSMVAYKTLNDVNGGDVGSIFEVFEYTTDGTPYGKPKISSGYAIVKAPGELIYRTTGNKEDVSVHVIHTGPVSSAGEYEYVVLSTNCNYPLYVFARDPVVYKQRHEVAVNSLLEHKGLVNGLSRLLNIVSPVDASMCSFPPSLFNIHG